MSAPLTAIRLWFSARPELTATQVTMVDSYGRPVPLGALERGEEPAEIRAAVPGGTAPGRYTVTWRIIGRDGHPVTGSFPVMIAGEIEPAPDTTPPVERGVTAWGPVAPVASASPLLGAARAMAFLSMVALIGAVAFAAAVAPRVPDLPVESRNAWTGTAAAIGLVAAFASCYALACGLLLQWRSIDLDGSMRLWPFITGTGWGRAWLLQAMSAAVAFAGFALVRHHAARVAVTSVAALGIAIGASLSGHAAATDSPGISVTADAIHILGASAWVGGLLCMMIVILRTRREPGALRMQKVAGLVSAFSPLALIAAAAVVLTGIAGAYLRIGTDFAWDSTYAQVLVVKVLLVAAMAAFGGYNWLRVRPSLATAADTRRLQRVAFMELAIGAAVIVVTAVLVATPLP